MSKRDQESIGKSHYEANITWRQRALALSLKPESYSAFGEQLLTLVGMVRKDLDNYRKSDLRHDKLLLLVENAMIIQEGCAELFADWQDGMEYEALRAQLLYHQGIWFDQLHFKV